MCLDLDFSPFGQIDFIVFGVRGACGWCERVEGFFLMDYQGAFVRCGRVESFLDYQGACVGGVG